jgi:hypothetical protein
MQVKLFFGSLVFVGVSILTSSANGQVKDAGQNLKQQAIRMGTAFTGADYKTFANYTYPLILRSMGGASKMIEVLNRTTQDMKAKGIIFSQVSFDDPSKIVKSGTELQATISQHTEIKLPQGRMVNTSTLIAVSADNGINWTFIDTSNKDMATLRRALPNLSPSINIPPAQPPVQYGN